MTIDPTDEDREMTQLDDEEMEAHAYRPEKRLLPKKFARIIHRGKPEWHVMRFIIPRFNCGQSRESNNHTRTKFA